MDVKTMKERIYHLKQGFLSQIILPNHISVTQILWQYHSSPLYVIFYCCKKISLQSLLERNNRKKKEKGIVIQRIYSADTAFVGKTAGCKIHSWKNFREVSSSLLRRILLPNSSETDTSFPGASCSVRSCWMFSAPKPAQPTLPAEEAAGPPQRGAAPARPGPTAPTAGRAARSAPGRAPGPAAAGGRGRRGVSSHVVCGPQQPQLPREDGDRSGKDGSRLIHIQVNLIASVWTL